MNVFFIQNSKQIFSLFMYLQLFILLKELLYKINSIEITVT